MQTNLNGGMQVEKGRKTQVRGKREKAVKTDAEEVASKLGPIELGIDNFCDPDLTEVNSVLNSSSMQRYFYFKVSKNTCMKKAWELQLDPHMTSQVSFM